MASLAKLGYLSIEVPHGPWRILVRIASTFVALSPAPIAFAYKPLYGETMPASLYAPLLYMWFPIVVACSIVFALTMSRTWLGKLAWCVPVCACLSVLSFALYPVCAAWTIYEYGS